VVAEASKIVSKLNIPEEALLEVKIKKLFAGVRDAKIEVAKVQF